MMQADLLELRRSLEAQIEMMIAILDAIDGDPDLEENGDEQDYNRIEYGTGECMGYPREDDEPDGDEEPALGWTLDGAHGHGDEEEELECNFEDSAVADQVAA